MIFENLFIEIASHAFLVYSLLLLAFYLLFSILAVYGIRRYLNRNSFTDYRVIISSPDAPSVSVIAPAYNEENNIVENVKSLLSLYYSNMEVILVNDGSKDQTLEKLIRAYDLEHVPFYCEQQLATQKVRGVYKSKNLNYKKLLVIDKENGGKADALNAGINASTLDHILCIDVDCILEPDAVAKMMKPFLEETSHKVVATGGVVRIANSCEIQDGRLVKVNLPTKYFARMQALEYMRAFVLGRMAWSSINGLLIISGAFGAFNKAVVIEAGGYHTSTVGEDMELVVRIRKLMEQKKEKYSVKFIPDPLCWTEAPADIKIFSRQRNRWARGTIETMREHKRMLFNPKYGVTGLLSYPYWLLYEMLGPLVELAGFLFFTYLAITCTISWPFYIALLLLVICLGYFYTVLAVIMEVLSYNRYPKFNQIWSLLSTGITEPFYYHQIMIWSSVKGFIDLIRGKKSWGEMSHGGFTEHSKS